MGRGSGVRRVPIGGAGSEVPMATRPVEDVQGHWLLARLGKRVLRPGGLRMTRTLLRDCGVEGQRIVEFAPGMGRTASLVLDHRPAGYVGVDADPTAARAIDRIVSPRGRAVAARADASGLPDGCADVVVSEGVLTIQSEAGKRAIVAEGARLLQPGGRYLLHELAVRVGADVDAGRIRGALAQAMHVNARPKSVVEWEMLLTESGLQVRTIHTGSLALLEPHRILADEGLVGALRFARNLLADKAARRRVRTMAATMRRHKPYLQAVGIVAVKPGRA